MTTLRQALCSPTGKADDGNHTGATDAPIALALDGATVPQTAAQRFGASEEEREDAKQTLEGDLIRMFGFTPASASKRQETKRSAIRRSPAIPHFNRYIRHAVGTPASWTDLSVKKIGFIWNIPEMTAFHMLLEFKWYRPSPLMFALVIPRFAGSTARWRTLVYREGRP